MVLMKVIWRCRKEGQWEAAVKSRTINKTDCPYCSHNKVLAGFNDLATLQPDIAARWSDRSIRYFNSGYGLCQSWSLVEV